MLMTPLRQSASQRRKEGEQSMHRLMVVFLLLAHAPQLIGEFRYGVRRDKLLGGETGVVRFEDLGFAYSSYNGKTVIELPYRDISKLDVADRRKIKIFTYERKAMRLTQRRKIEFELIEGAVSDRLPQFLADRLERPVLGATAEEPPGMRVLAYHRHLFGGCNGVLVLGDTTVQFVGNSPQHSRTWFFEDIETIGSMNPFHFRMSSYAETYNFDLKERLSEESYRDLWLRVYGTTTTQQSQPINKEIDRL